MPNFNAVYSSQDVTVVKYLDLPNVSITNIYEYSLTVNKCVHQIKPNI